MSDISVSVSDITNKNRRLSFSISVRGDEDAFSVANALSKRGRMESPKEAISKGALGAVKAFFRQSQILLDGKADDKSMENISLSIPNQPKNGVYVAALKGVSADDLALAKYYVNEGSLEEAKVLIQISIEKALLELFDGLKGAAKRQPPVLTAVPASAKDSATAAPALKAGGLK